MQVIPQSDREKFSAKADELVTNAVFLANARRGAIVAQCIRSFGIDDDVFLGRFLAKNHDAISELTDEQLYLFMQAMFVVVRS